MSNIDPDRLDMWLAKAEGKLSRLKRKSAAKEKLDLHLSRLVDYSKSKRASTAEKVKIQEKLASIEQKLAQGGGDVVPALKDVEKMVDEIYGDQSKNETFYFQRRRRQASQKQANWYDKTAASPDKDGKPWYKVPLEEAEEHSDQMYGDQSANETYYFERREDGGEDLPRWAQKDADRDVKSYNVAPDQFRLKDREFDAQNVVHNWYEEQNEQKEASSYIPGLEEGGLDAGNKDYTQNPGEWWKEDRQSSQNAGNWYSKKKMRRR